MEQPSLDDRILALLERFRQMTAPHLLMAGVDANADYLNTRLQSLRKRRLIYCAKPGVNFGKLPYVYALSGNGAERLAQLWKMDREALHHYRQEPHVSASQYNHRRVCITAHIVAVNSLGQNVLRWIPEYGGGHLEGRAPTLLRLAQGRTIRPDALFAVDHRENGGIMAYALEVHASTGAQRSRLLDQLESHRQCQGLRLVSKALRLGENYNAPRDYVTLVVVPDDATRASLSEHLQRQQDFTRAREWFRCKTFDELRLGFSGWTPLVTD